LEENELENHLKDDISDVGSARYSDAKCPDAKSVGYSDVEHAGCQDTEGEGYLCADGAGCPSTKEVVETLYVDDLFLTERRGARSWMSEGVNL